MNSSQRSEVAATTWTFAALLGLTVLSYLASRSEHGAGEATPILFGSAFVKLGLIAWIFMELGAGRGRWLGLALALFGLTLAALLLVLPPG
jgi:hypothetical protein